MSMLLALLTGAVISIMVSINGGLTACVGEYTAAVVIHVVGTAFALILCLIRREKIFARRHAPAWTYLGGVIGVLTTFFNNFAFGRISVTSLTALDLLGQTMTAALISRTVNARLSQKASALTGSFFNHLTGLPCCLLLCLLAGGTALKASAAPAPWMLCGGMLGVTVVLLLNITVPRIAPSA